MLSTRGGRRVGHVRIVIHIDQAQPPAGRIAVLHDDELAPDGGAGAFSGWLDLIRVLEQVIGGSTSP